jgi:adenosylcobyric acid synthase
MEAGFTPVLRNLIEQGRSLIGICGGYQMLGTRIRDPYGIESAAGCIEGLGFLPIETVLKQDKTLTRVSGRCRLDKIGGEQEKGVPIEGYEIHMGKTTVLPGARRPFTIESKGSMEPEHEEGAASPDNLVWGTYLHGLFENDLFRERFLNLHGRHGPSELSYKTYLDAQFDRLAAHIEGNVDVERILKAADRYR